MSQAFNFGNPVNPDNADGSPPQVYTLGCEWESNVVGVVKGNRWRAPTNSATVACQMVLYRKSDMAQVAISAFFTPTNGVDNDVLFTTPFTIAAATRYISGVLTDRYASTLGGWPFTTLNLTAPAGVNGRLAFTVAGVPVFPSTIHSSAANFFIGPLFDPLVTAALTPTVISLSAQATTGTPGMITVPLPPTVISMSGQPMLGDPVPGSPIEFYLIMTEIGQCVVNELTATPKGAPDRICLSVPGEIAWDDCECGSFTQTVSRWLWSENAQTDVPLIGLDNHCRTNYLGVEVVALVLRCAPQPDDGQLAPTCAALDTASQIWHRDSFALRRGVVCCLSTKLAAGDIEGYQVTSHPAVGPAGLCVGSELTYRFWLPNCDCL